MKRSSQRQRKASGNMLILVCVTMGLISLALTIGLSFGGLFLAQTVLQNFANQLALSGAVLLNGGNKLEQANGINSSDRIGQMNNMIARSRSAVNECKLNSDDSKSENDDPELQALAGQLYDSACDGAQTMEPERQKLKAVAEQEVADEITNEMKQMSKFSLVLPWLTISSPKLSLKGVEFGQIKDVQSNVMVLDTSNNLSDDSSFTNATNKRYKANVNAQLQGIDRTIDFKLSSLQPPVKDEVAPARLVLPSAWAETPQGDQPNGYLCSAVKVTLEMNVATSLGTPTKNIIKVVGFAATSGGSDMR
ncbi:MAG: hypothetical protein ACRD3W_13850 [Terriglobales bacterium]